MKAAAQAVVAAAKKVAREERRKEREERIRQRRLEAKQAARKAELHNASQSFLRNTFCLFCGAGAFPLDCGCRWFDPVVVIDNKIIAIEWKIKFMSQVSG